MSFNKPISIPGDNDSSPPILNHQHLHNYFNTNNNESPSPTSSDSLSNNHQFILNIRFPHSSETHQCVLKSASNTLVSELLQAIREQCLEKDKTLRSNENYSPSKSILKLIHHGRLLTPPTFPISRFNIQPENFIHCTFSPIQQPSNNSQQHSSSSSTDIRQGFDMLLNAGLAREEVNEVRRQFYASHSNLLELHRRGQLTQRDLFEIEQQWMQNDHVQTENDQNSSIRPTNLVDTNNVGNIYHFFCGVFLGFFLGFVSLIALLENSLSKRFQFGIRCGVTTMVLLSVFKYYFPTLLPYMM